MALLFLIVLGVIAIIIVKVAYIFTFITYGNNSEFISSASCINHLGVQI